MEVLIFALSVVFIAWLVLKVNQSSLSNQPVNNPYVPSYKDPTAVAEREQKWLEKGLALKEFPVVGVHIAVRKNHILYSCKEGDYVELKHEKTNKYSNRAIMVRCNDKKIGYIPEIDLDEAHEILDRLVIAFISGISYDYDYINVHIKVCYK